MIGGALALQILYIKNNQNTDAYLPHQVSAVVMDTLVVVYLMFVVAFYRPYNNPIQAGIAVSLLIIGLGVEIFFTQFELNVATTWLSYFLAATNSMIRLFILVQVRCNSSASTIAELTREIIQTAKATGTPVAETAKAAAAPLVSIDPQNIWLPFTSALSNLTLDADPVKDREIKSKLKDETRTKVFGLPPRERGGRR